MRLVKIGLASVNTTVGATHANVERALRFAKEMAAADVTVAVYPEQMIGGYPPEDLIQWQGFVEDQWRALQQFARETRGNPFLLGELGAQLQRGEDGPGDPDWRPPPEVRRTVGVWLSGLTPDTRTLLAHAAVFREGFGFGDIGRIGRVFNRH